MKMDANILKDNREIYRHVDVVPQDDGTCFFETTADDAEGVRVDAGDEIEVVSDDGARQRMRVVHKYQELGRRGMAVHLEII
jgi:hypothetical protein